MAELESARATRDAALQKAFLDYQQDELDRISAQNIANETPHAAARAARLDPILQEIRSLREEILRRRDAGEDYEELLAKDRALRERKKALRSLDRATDA